ncbi:hypothetical protein MOUN0_E01728 [Monosporozyma unispora]|nr:hypothetical protein C6P44_003739 [Kazachstania unispora]
MTVSAPRKYNRSKRAKISNDQNQESIAMDKLAHVILSEEQLQLKTAVLEFVEKHLANEYQKITKSKEPAMFVIQGDAGTGKSVVLNSLFNEIQKIANTEEGFKSILHGTSNYLVVNHPEMLKLYHRISKRFKYITKASLERPTSLINNLTKQKKTVDVVIIDEGHLLATSKDAFKRFYGQNQLEELMSLAKVIIIVYDDKQSLRMGSYWEDNEGGQNNGATLKTYYELIPKDKKEWYRLKQQFRVVAPKDVLDWIDTISVKGLIPKFPQTTTDFDFKIWNDCGEMYEALKAKNDKYGQCRMLATYDFPYRLDGKDYFVTCGDNFKLRWDRYQPRAVLPWSERADSIDEVGSVYTVQGFDLNYSGVILGRSIGYDKANDCLRLIPELYDDHAGFTKKKNISDADYVKHKIIMNSLNVLLTRGTKGLYIYPYDDELRKRLLNSTSS